jgi:hypothetical protein
LSITVELEAEEEAAAAAADEDLTENCFLHGFLNSSKLLRSGVSQMLECVVD